MRKNLLCTTAILSIALLLPAVIAAGEVNRDPRGPISAQDFGLPPVSPSQFDAPPPVAGPTMPPARYYYAPAPAAQGSALPPSAVYTAQNIAPEGTANFLDPHVAAMTMQNPLPPAPSAISSGAVPVNQARPLPAPSAPYAVPSQAIVPMATAPAPAPIPVPMTLGPVPAMTQPQFAQGTAAPIMLPPITATVNVVPGATYAVSGTGTNDIVIQTPYPAVTDSQSNVISFVVPIQIPVPAQQQAVDYAALQQQAQIAAMQYAAAQQAAAQQPPFAPVSTPAVQSVAAMTPGSTEYLDFSSLPTGSVVVVTPSQVKDAIMRGARMILLDVRAELVRDVEGHVIGDVNVEFTPRQTFVARVAARMPDRSIPIVTYCHDGIWSAQAAADLAQAGYRVFHMGAFRLWL